jgi:phosphoribosylformimino-5-aminoimidazole carboxamide ribotide isomerase
MHIIGVIDLRGGRAVHARGGNRDTYALVQTTPPAIEAGNSLALADWYATRGVSELYVADLDAIAGKPLQRAAIRDLASRTGRLWLDAGIRTVTAIGDALDTGARDIVIGLETLASFDELAQMCAGAGSGGVVFSLDLRDGKPMAVPDAGRHQTPLALAMRATECGVRSIIVLDVARVGTDRGPDFQLLSDLTVALPDVAFVAGGGVRTLDDLARLEKIGCSAALVASALLDGRLAATHRSVSR